MIKNKFNISCTSYLIINNRGKVIGERSLSSLISYKKLIKRCEIGLSTVVLNSEILKLHKFPILKTQEDFALWLKLLRNGYKFGLINLYIVYIESMMESKPSVGNNGIYVDPKLFPLYVVGFIHCAGWIFCNKLTYRQYFNNFFEKGEFS